MQNVPDLISLMGGTKAFCTELDRNFEEGYYRHDNEPGHHLPIYMTTVIGLIRFRKVFLQL